MRLKRSPSLRPGVAMHGGRGLQAADAQVLVCSVCPLGGVGGACDPGRGGEWSPRDNCPRPHPDAPALRAQDGRPPSGRLRGLSSRPAAGDPLNTRPEGLQPRPFPPPCSVSLQTKPFFPFSYTCQKEVLVPFFLESKSNITIVSAKLFLNLYNVPENRN